MLHTYYYVNGQRVSMEKYLVAAENNAYNQAAFKKAKEYFERHQGEWLMLCASTPEESLPIAMVLHFEHTYEGETFQKEWKLKMQRQNKIGYIVGCLIILAAIIIGILVATSGHNLEKYKITKEKVQQYNNGLVTFSTKTFSIKYPADWELTEGDLGVIRIKSKTEDIGFSIVQFDPKLSFATIQQTRDPIKKDEGYEVGEKQTIIIDDTELYETIYVKTNNGQSQAIMSYLFNKNGIVYNIEFNNCYTSDSKHKVLDIIKTLHLTNE